MAILEGEVRPSKQVKRLRAELHLQPEQLPKLMTCLDDLDPIMKHDEAADPSQGFDAVEDSLLKVFGKVLNGKQQARFEELGCQAVGPMALRLKHYAARMDLSAAQRNKIDELVNTYTDKAAALWRASFVISSDTTYRKLKVLAWELDEKILNVLTPKQRAKWTGLLGTRFDWSGVVEE